MDNRAENFFLYHRDKEDQMDTLRWSEGRLSLLDQRELPAVVSYLEYDTVEGVYEAIRDMVAVSYTHLRSGRARLCLWPIVPLLSLIHILQVPGKNIYGKRSQKE